MKLNSIHDNSMIILDLYVSISSTQIEQHDLLDVQFFRALLMRIQSNHLQSNINTPIHWFHGVLLRSIVDRCSKRFGTKEDWVLERHHNRVFLQVQCDDRRPLHQ